MLYLSTDLHSPAEYCTSGKFICPGGGAVHPERILSSFVVLFGCEGEYRIEQNGTEYSLVPGSYMILFSGIKHRGTLPCAPGLSHYWCHFNLHDGYSFVGESETQRIADEISSKNDRISSNLTGIYRSSSLILPEYGTVPSTESFRLLFHSLIDCSRSMNVYRGRICDLIITQILYELSGAFISQQETEGGQKQRYLAEKVVEYIRLNAAELKSVAEVAEFFGYNPEYLTTIVRQSTKMTVMEHINKNKIEEAKKLLLSTNLRISEIAAMSGFTDPKYFSKLFHRLTDATPSEYRNAYFKIHTNNF